MLNIYKISGIGAIRDNGKYRVWTADTVEPTNTVAFNYLLSEVNVLCAESDVTKDTVKEAEILNNVDLMIICLEGLIFYQNDPEKYPLDFVGAVISEMVADGKFVADFTDDVQRANNLDVLIAEFESRLSDTLTGMTDVNFNNWWTERIVAYDYNYTTSEQLKRYNEIIGSNKEENSKVSDKTGRLSDGRPETMAEYISDAGDSFLYMFIPDNELHKYNSTIRFRRKIEINKNREFLVKNMGAVYNKQTLDNYLRTGVIAEYGMTPEEKLQQVLENGGAISGGKISGGKIGDFGLSAILAIITVAIAALSVLLDFVVNMYAVSVQKPTGYEDGVPNEEVDLNSALASEEESGLLSGDNKWILFGGAAAVLMYLIS